MIEPFWLISAISLLCLHLIARSYGIWILEKTVSLALPVINNGVLRSGKQISGPSWQAPNGTLIERFVNGRANSVNWQKYGLVYRIWSGTHPEIVITTPEDLKHFSSDANDHPKTPNVNLGWFAGELLGRAMGLLYGDDWKRLRKIFDPPFTHSAAVTRVDDVNEAARRYVKDLYLLAHDKTAPLSGKVDESFTLPVLTAFIKFPYFLTARAIYGPMTEEEEEHLWDVTQKRMALNQYWIVGGPYRVELAANLYNRAAVRQLREFSKDWHDYNSRMVEVRRKRNERPPIIAYWEEVEKGNMKPIELLHTLDELLMLNLDVITHVNTWLITLVADHDSIKQELRDEIAVNKDDLKKYLASTDTHVHRCFLESMRIRPFSVFTIGESSARVKNFHGVLVKPYTQILVDVLAINVRNPFWGPKSEDFDPSRLKNIKQSDLRYNLHSFGIGSRKCMGQYVAGHIIKALIVHLFDEYEVQLVKEPGGSENYDTDKSSWTPKADTSLLLTKREGSLH